jgi:hypothetical protein
MDGVGTMALIYGKEDAIEGPPIMCDEFEGSTIIYETILLNVM